MHRIDASLAELQLDPRPIADDDGKDGFSFIAPFEYRDVAGGVDGIAWSDSDALHLQLSFPVTDFDSERLEAVSLPPPVDDIDIWFDADDDGEPAGDGDVAHLEIHTTTASVSSTGIELALASISAFVSDLLDEGILCLTDASDLDEVAEIASVLAEIKAANPWQAVDMAEHAAALCMSVGDPSTAAFLSLAAAEVLLDMGEVRRASGLAEDSWRRLGKPLVRDELLTIVARARSMSGQLGAARGLMEEGIAAAESPASRSRLEGNLGVLFAHQSRRPEAIALLTKAIASPQVDPVDRVVFVEQLAVLRNITGSDETVIETPTTDVTDDAAITMNQLAALLLASTRPELERRRPRIDELVGDLEHKVARLGSAHHARVAHARGVLAYLDGDATAARREIELAVRLAEDAGDVTYLGSLQTQAASFGFTSGVAPRADSSIFDQIIFYTNKAMTLVPQLADGDAGRAAREGLSLLQRALGVVDAERHRYRSVDDRRRWYEFSTRVYELNLLFAEAAGDHALVFEVLERARGQGLPLTREATTAPLTAPSPLEESPTESRRTDEDLVGAVGLGGAREALGDLPVGPATIASPRDRGAWWSVRDGIRRVGVDEVITAVAGAGAWWWGCHLFGERLYWVLRDPSGGLTTGFGMIAGGLGALDELIGPFSSIHSSDELREHPLYLDEHGRLSELLDGLAALLLPSRLQEVVAAAAHAGVPIDLVVAAPKELVALPLLLFPVGGGHRLIEGARLVLAPPTSIVTAARATAEPSFDGRPVLVVLGADPDLSMLDRLVGEPGMGLPAAAVLGTTRHVRSGLAAGVATPAAVLRAAHANPGSIAVYYGHIDQQVGMPLSAAMSLTDGRSRDVLRAADLLVSERDGAPHAVVLAGCSSLSATAAGTGEWWGLGIGLLWQGAHHVAGSTWDLLHGEATMQLVTEIVSSLRARDRPHHVLHRVQLDRFRRWAVSKEQSVPTEPGDQPYVWAGWSIVSADPSQGTP